MSTKSRASADAPWLDQSQERAWRAFRRMMVRVQERTARDLADIGLSEADYEVLSTLSEAPERTSTLHAQAAKMAWSRSRLSRHASRMETRGLIERRPDPTDGRGCLLVLSDRGLEILQEAAPAHVASVRRHVIDRLSHDELGALERISDKLYAADDGPAAEPGH